MKELIDGEISDGGAISYEITAASTFVTNAISLSSCFHCNATRRNIARRDISVMARKKNSFPIPSNISQTLETRKSNSKRNVTESSSYIYPAVVVKAVGKCGNFFSFRDIETQKNLKSAAR